MDKETRTNQGKVRRQKNESDRYIWDKVPPKPSERKEAEYARRDTPQRIEVEEDAQR